MKRTLLLVALAALFVTMSRPGPAHAFEALWLATSGAPPDSVCPPWTRSASVPSPVASGVMTITTTQCSQNASFGHLGTDVAIPDSLVVEARLRVVSRGECEGPCGHYRDVASFAISVAPQTGILVFVGQDEVFLTNGECAGIASAVVDTDGAMHTYRINVLATGVVRVYYDDALLLTGHTYTSLADHGTGPRVWFGEGSSFAYGTAHWAWVRHNAHATGCVPTSVATAGGVMPGDRAGRELHPAAWPNPTNAETTIGYAVAQPGRVRMDLYDASGRWVRDLVDAERAAGDYQVTWDGRDAAGRPASPGTYLYRVLTPGGVSTGKILRTP